MLDFLQPILERQNIVGMHWHLHEDMKGRIVRLARHYYDGQHRQKLTADMRKMLRIQADGVLERFDCNYCEMIVDTLTARLKVQSMQVTSEADSADLEAYLMQVLPEGADIALIRDTLVRNYGASGNNHDEAQAWVEGLMEHNRFDELQRDVQQAAVRDGVTYVLSEYNDEDNMVRLYHEPAWDGITGTIAIYDDKGDHIVAAIKAWHYGSERRANIYYPDRVERYITHENDETMSSLVPFGEDHIVPTVRNGQAAGVPIIEFGKGKSVLLNAIPLQDSLNRHLMSMVMSGELSAFAILLSKGLSMPAGVTPGMIIRAELKDENGQPMTPDTEEMARAYASMLGAMDLKRIEGSSLEPFISAMEFIISRIGDITHTPLPNSMGSSTSSGEALKQRESGLLGKVRDAHVYLGNSWEDVFKLAHRQSTLFGLQRPPRITAYSTRWTDAQLRNDADIREAAKQMYEWGHEREALRLFSQTSLVDYTDDDIDRLMIEKSQSVAQIQANSIGNVLPMSEFNL